MKPTKKILKDFPEVEKELVKRYEAYKKEKSVACLAELAIFWGKYGTYRSIFELSGDLPEQKMTDIYFAITDHDRRLRIYD